MFWVVARPGSTGSGRKPMSTKGTPVGCSMPSPSTPGRSAVSSCILRLSGSPRDKYGDSTIDKVTGGSHQQLEDQLGPSSARIHGGVWTGPTGTNAAPFLGIADEHGPRLAHTEDLSGYIASAEVMYLYGPSAAARCAGHDRVGRDPTRTAHLRLRKGRWTRLIETPGLLTIRLPPGAGVEIARLLVLLNVRGRRSTRTGVVRGHSATSAILPTGFRTVTCSTGCCIAWSKPGHLQRRRYDLRSPPTRLYDVIRCIPHTLRYTAASDDSTRHPHPSTGAHLSPRCCTPQPRQHSPEAVESAENLPFELDFPREVQSPESRLVAATQAPSSLFCARATGSA